MIALILPDTVSDKAYSYTWPADWPAPTFGQVVKVEFGKKARFGLVMGIESAAEPTRTLKAVLKLIRPEPYLDERECQIAEWLAEHYFVSLAEALFGLLPPNFTKKSRTAIKTELGVAKSHVPFLTDEQRRAVTAMRSGTQLLFGVTGSGKTEVYLEIAEKMRQSGKQIAILVPEISLTPQTTRRFLERFSEPIAIYHSMLSAAERTAIWHAVKCGELGIVVGSRSALLLPYQNLGLIAVDEEHDSSYQQEQSPYYDARDLAEQLTVLDPSLLTIFGSATPRLATYLRAKAGKIGLVELKERYGIHLPDVHIIDRRHDRAVQTALLGPVLKEALSDALEHGSQAILFLNRRGLAGAVICQDCGNALLCPSCDLPLTYHKQLGGERPLICHHCGYETAFPPHCPVCRHPLFRGGQWGTEALERELRITWPGARLLRLDRDSMKNHAQFVQLYEDFRHGRADILMGTTLVTKGWDIPNVQLVGVVSADQQLYFPDYQATERAFSLFTQVAGRAGRRESGTVYIQTLSPEHPAVQAAAHHDYVEFARAETGFRRAEHFPPFAELIQVTVRGRDEVKTRVRLERIAEQLQPFVSENCQLLGPAACFFPRLAEYFRFQLLIKVRAWPDGLADRLRVLQGEAGLTVRRNPSDML